MDSLRKQIYGNLNLKDTPELLKIWALHDTGEWQAESFEIIEQILSERLGYPPQARPTVLPNAELAQDEDYIEAQRLLDLADAHLLLKHAYHSLNARSLLSALDDCSQAIQLAPDLSEAYTCRGQVYEAMGRDEDALADYAAALHLDLDDSDAFAGLTALEEELDERFQSSAARQHLDRAAEFVLDDEPNRALDEIEFARRDLPNIAPAYTELGSIYAGLGRWEQAEEAFQKAIRLNPRYYQARERLAAAKVQLEAERYRQAVMESEARLDAEDATAENDASMRDDLDAIETENLPAETEGEPVPGWVYLGEKEFHISGWPGHRTRPGRSGYDPLETDFEQAHVTGVIIRQLLTLQFRTRNPVYLIIMAVVGLLCLAPLLLVGQSMADGQSFREVVYVLITFAPFLVLGAALVINVVLSILSTSADEND